MMTNLFRVLHYSRCLSTLRVKVCGRMFKASCYYRYFRGDYITHLTKGAGFCFYFHEALELYIMFNNFIYYLFTGNLFQSLNRYKDNNDGGVWRFFTPTLQSPETSFYIYGQRMMTPKAIATYQSCHHKVKVFTCVQEISPSTRLFDHNCIKNYQRMHTLYAILKRFKTFSMDTHSPHRTKCFWRLSDFPQFYEVKRSLIISQVIFMFPRG